jgi:hypothetical protein
MAKARYLKRLVLRMGLRLWGGRRLCDLLRGGILKEAPIGKDSKRKKSMKRE